MRSLCAKPKAIELFAGAGLFSYAFTKEGFEVVQAVELDSVACETYRLNLGDHIVQGDVRKVQPYGKCDVLIAGPPCQGFSTLNRNRGDDERNALSFEVAKWARKTSPAIVVVENVNVFPRSDAWGRMARSLRRQGYQIDTRILNARDFGVPQKRSRSFTVAFKTGEFRPKRLRIKSATTVREAFKDLPEKPNGVNHHSAPNPSELAAARMNHIPLGGDKRDIMQAAPDLCPPSWRAVETEATDVWGRMVWDEPSNTLRTCLQNPSKGRYIHPEQDRVISLREAARLHSIPDSWTFSGLPTHIARQIGNSVPPNLGRAVARAVRNML